MIQGIKRLSTTAQFNAAPLLQEQKFIIVLSGESHCCWHCTVPVLGEAPSSHFSTVTWLRTCLIEISERIMAILELKMASDFFPHDISWLPPNLPWLWTCFWLCLFWALRVPTVGQIIVLHQAESTALSCCAPSFWDENSEINSCVAKRRQHGNHLPSPEGNSKWCEE